MGELVTRLRSQPPATWLRAAAYAVVAAAVIAVPSALVDTPLFGRPVPVRPIDYVILAVSASLIGTIVAVRVPDGPRTEAGDRRTVWGGFVSFLAVGCPVCNQAVVALVGTSGALAWWAPLQPLIGILAVGLLVGTLRHRLLTFDLAACPVPVDHRRGIGRA